MQDILSESMFDIRGINEKTAENKAEAMRAGEEKIGREAERTAKAIFDSGAKIVLISGPSSSGKTTFTKKVCEKLCDMGGEARHISLDDFFLGIEYLPLNDDGTYDMESIKGLDTALANECFRLLLREGRANFPTFDFPKQRRGEKWNLVETGEKGHILIEGIHALNPLLTENLPEKGVMRVYIEPENGYELFGETVFSPRDIRLMRRMTRDELFRGWSAEKTLMQWKSVLAGEKIYIEPYTGLADIKVNSSVEYEPAVFRKILTGLLLKISENSPFFDEAKRFMEKLSLFDEIEPDFLAKDSLLREFVG